MNPLEKGTLALTKLFLANQKARILFMCYCLALHGLVVLVLYYGAFEGTLSHDEGNFSPPPGLVG